MSADRAGQSSSACKLVLVGLANHSGPNGTPLLITRPGDEAARAALGLFNAGKG